MKLDGKVLDFQQETLVKEMASYLCIAGAGTGKTFTIVAKIKYYLEQGIDKNKILVVAYTKLSALEIERRLQKEQIRMHIYTFHSLAYTKTSKKIISKNDFNYIKYRFQNENAILLKRVLKTKSQNEKARLWSDLETTVNNILVNDYDIVKLNKCFHNKHYYKLLYAYYNFYLTYLKEHNLIDFPLLITEAIGRIDKSFDYVIVDEFQDISKNRFLLINSIVKNNQAKLYCFGDDYQSIYMFSGSKIVYFLDFEKYTGISKKLFLLNTYRSSKELLFVANLFIQKNKKQIQKSLASKKSLQQPIIIMYLEFSQALTYILETIDKDQDLLILMRYTFLAKSFIKMFVFKKNYYTYKNYKNKITFLTIHKAKGLEADNVLVIDMLNEKYGFPSKVKKNNLAKFDNYKEIMYAEERRLFYVALTRTKNKVFLLSKKNRESCFLKEIKSYANIKVLK